MQKFECLNNIIGVTKDYCQCLHDKITPEEFAQYTESKSGLYLDNVEGGVFLRSVPRVDMCKTFFDWQIEAIENAKKFFTADLLAELNIKYQTKKTQYVGEIGSVSYTGSLDKTSKRLQFVKLKANNDAVLNLDRIRIFTNTELTSKIWIFRVEDGATSGEMVFETEPIESQSRLITHTFNTPLKMPLTINGRKQTYFVLYETIGAVVKPRDLKTSCGCSGGDGFSDFVFVTGGEVDMFSELPTATTDVFTHGISLDVQIKCESGAIICKEYDQNDGVAYVTAFAILYKSAELVVEAILNSTDINRFTMLSRDNLYGKRNHFRKEYQNRVRYLAENIDVTASDCFICRDSDIYIAPILV